MLDLEKIKELRAKTHFSMSECRQALTEAGGSVDLAVDILKKKGLKKVETIIDSVSGRVQALANGNSGRIAEYRLVGETESLKREMSLSVTDGFVHAYNHHGGKIAVLVSLFGDDSESTRQAAENVAMHIAAAKPEYIYRLEVPVDIIQKQKKFFVEGLPSGKNQQQLDKIIDGKLNKWFSEFCLADQSYILEPSLTVQKYLSDKGLRVCQFVRYELGER